MTPQEKTATDAAGDSLPLGRREVLAYTAAFGGAFLAAQGLAAGASEASRTPPRGRSPQARQEVRHEEVDQPLGPPVSRRR